MRHAKLRSLTEISRKSPFLSLVLICRRCICEVGAGTTWATFRTNENMRLRQLEPSRNFTAAMPAKLNSSQLCSYAWGKDWDEQCCRPLLFSYRNSIPGRTGGHVAGASEAYENQALYMNRSKIRYRFRVGARAIWYSVLRQPTT